MAEPWVYALGVTLLLAFLVRLLWRQAARLETERRTHRERERHLQLILENVADAIMIVGPDGRVHEASPGAARLFGRPLSAIRGAPCRAVVHPGDMEIYDQVIRTLLGTPGLEVRRELRFLHEGEGVGWMELVATNLLAEPSCGGFLIQARETTAFHRAEEALLEREALLWATVSQVPALLWVADRELRVIHVMGAGLRSLGLSTDRVQGARIYELLGAAPESPAFRKAMSGRAGEIETELRGRVLRSYVEPFRGRGGEVAGVLGLSIDTTEMNRAQAALMEEGRLHRILAENAGDVVAKYDLDGKALYVSPACQFVLGFTPDEFRRQELAELVHPDDRTSLADARTRAGAGEPVRSTYRVRKRDGTYAWFETLARPVRDHDGRPVAVVTSSRDVTERRQIEEQLRHMAFHDPMTGLPNRIAFTNRLTQALAAECRHRLAIVHIDVDNFKVVNDSLGHQAGDDALVEIGDRLRRTLPGQMVARLGGDEFAVLLEGVTDTDSAIDSTERIAAAMDLPLKIEGREFQITYSFGIAMGTPRLSTAKELLREADVALRYAKRQGKGRYVLYHPSMIANALERLELDADLRRAIRDKQLSLYYQPIVALKSRAVLGAEALIRWRHPRRGWVSPGEFIPIAEQTGFIVPLGKWVLEQACQEARTWQQRFHPEMPLTVSVNLSAVQVQDPALVDEVAEVLERTGLNPANLTLEITETALMKNPEFTRPILQRLKALGVKLAMDDFGAGHSSLQYLKQFPIDVLKIDRSFVSGLGLNRVDSALVRTVISLAGALNMDVTAEGVESPEQVTELLGIGCSQAQGYYYALPVPADELGPVLSGLSLRAVKGL